MISFISQESKEHFQWYVTHELVFQEDLCLQSAISKMLYRSMHIFFLYLLVFLDTGVNDKHRKPRDTTMTQTSAARLVRESSANRLWQPIPLPNWRTAPTGQTWGYHQSTPFIHAVTYISRASAAFHRMLTLTGKGFYSDIDQSRVKEGETVRIQMLQN